MIFSSAYSFTVKRLNVSDEGNKSLKTVAHALGSFLCYQRIYLENRDNFHPLIIHFSKFIWIDTIPHSYDFKILIGLKFEDDLKSNWNKSKNLPRLPSAIESFFNASHHLSVIQFMDVPLFKQSLKRFTANIYVCAQSDCTQ